MKKLERVNTVLRGDSPDRAPMSCWYHFGHQFLPGEKFAELACAFFDYYDFDWLKVMNDYFYPMPKEMTALKSAADLKKLTPFEIEQSPLNEQLKALRLIQHHLADRAYFVDTVFDPYQALQRSPVGQHLPVLIEEQPQAVLDALDVVTENLIAYAKKSLAAGSAGIFVSILASKEQMTRDDFLRFVKPFAMRLFEAVKDDGPMNTLHVHGHHIDTDNVLDFPVNIISWEDRVPDNPSLQEMKDRFPGCVMGGIDNTIVTRHTPEYLMNMVREGMAMGGTTRFFLANGCSIPGSMSPFALKCMVEVAQGIRE